MYCTQCGTKLPDGTPVCPNCNTALAPKEEVKAVEPEVQVVGQPEVQPEVQVQPEIPPVPEMQPQIQPEAAEPQPQMPVQPQMAPGGFDPMTGQPLNGAPVAPQQPKEKKPLLKNKLFIGLMAGGAAL